MWIFDLNSCQGCVDGLYRNLLLLLEAASATAGSIERRMLTEGYRDFMDWQRLTLKLLLLLVTWFYPFCPATRSEDLLSDGLTS